MNLWLDLSRTVGEALRTNPVLVLLLIVAPLLALACFRRVYPAMALLFWSLPQLNWAGLYLLEPGGRDLLLGPFQGKPACVRIPVGRGVCGTAAERRETVVVPDVHAFPGHIACDVSSRSEIVVPILRDDRLLGVLDLDSPVHSRFDAADARGLERLVEVFVASLA